MLFSLNSLFLRALRILKLLLEAKASKDKTSYGGLTPLMTAAAKGHAELLGEVTPPNASP